MTAGIPPLGYKQVAEVLKKLDHLEHQIVLVGGQAVTFWASFYERRVLQLTRHRPFTSKDIDFIGSGKAARECAKRLGGTARLATLDDMNTPSTGCVVFVDDQGYQRQIDFLGILAGVSDADVVDTAIPATIDDEHGTPMASFLVINPLVSLKSRTHNVAYLPGYQTDHAKNQLAMAIICARQFAIDLLPSDPSRTLTCNEAVFSLARYRAGLEVFALHQIDVLDALADAPGLPEKFYTERLPRALAAVERARAKRLEALERTKAWEARKGS